MDSLPGEADRATRAREGSRQRAFGDLAGITRRWLNGPCWQSPRGSDSPGGPGLD